MGPEPPDTLSFDPGESFGWASWASRPKTVLELLDAGTEEMWAMLRMLHRQLVLGVVEDSEPNWLNVRRIICEDWALYEWKLKDLAWDKCRTARAIGAVELIAWAANLELILQSAQIKERAVAGGVEEFFRSPRRENRHANDAIMHGWFWTQMRLAEQAA